MWSLISSGSIAAYSLRAAEVDVALEKLLADGKIEVSPKERLDWSHSFSPA